MNKIIVGMGEALWDVLPEGKKIGGAPANFAYHVSQFGFDSRVVSAVGRDADGQEILDVFAQKKLTCEIEQVDYPTGTVQITLDAVGVPCYEIKEGVAWDNIPFTDDLKRLALSTRAVCFGSLAQRSPVSRATIQRFLDTMPDGEDQIKIFDINLRQQYVVMSLTLASFSFVLSETFPTLDCSQCILTPRMVEVAQHPNITLYTYAELESLEGFIGNFKASIRLKAKSIDEKLCTGCGLCTTKCPTKKIPSEFNAGLGMRTAIYVPFPQAVPNKPVIDRVHCTHFRTGRCGVCEKVCPTGAIRFDQEDRIISENVGAIVVTTGFNVLNTDFFPEYGYGKYKDIITGIQFERLASASGPTLGEIRRPSDGKIPQKIVFVACAGSRDPAHATNTIFWGILPSEGRRISPKVGPDAEANRSN